MTKNPGFYFFPGDWLTDPALTKCREETRGVWIDLLCVIHQVNQGGRVSGTVQQISRLARTSVRVLKRSARDLLDNSAAIIEGDLDGVITITCKRMVRDEEKRKYEREKKMRQRHRNQGERDSDGDMAGENAPPVPDPSRARAHPNLTQPDKTAAAESVQQGTSKRRSAAAAPLGFEAKDTLARKLILNAECENLTAPDRKIFHDVAQAVLDGKLPESTAVALAVKAAKGTRNKAGLFRRLVSEHQE